MTDIQKIESLVSQNKIEEVKQSLKDNNLKTKYLGKLLLMAAYSYKAGKDMIIFLLESGANPNYETSHRETPVSICSNKGDFESVKILLEAGSKADFLCWSELVYAIVFKSIDECRKLVESGASLTVRDRYWQRTPLFFAVQIGDIEKVKLLLEHGSNINEKGWCEENIVYYAIKNDQSEMLKFLISQSADIFYSDENNQNYLMKASELGASKCVEILIGEGLDVQEEDWVQSQAIDMAMNIETVKILQKYGANINRINGEGYNLLMYAVEMEDTCFLKELLDLGADPNVTSTGAIALHKSVYMDNVESIKMLLDAGSNANAEDVDGWTPIFSVKSVEAAELLLEFGADPRLEDCTGTNAIKRQKNKEIKKLFKEKIH